MNIFKSEKAKKFDEEIENLLNQLGGTDGETEQYKNTVNNLEVLCRARASQKDLGVNKDAAIAIGANMFGLLLVLGYERLHVISSKAFSMLFRSRI